MMKIEFFMICNSDLQSYNHGYRVLMLAFGDNDIQSRWDWLIESLLLEIMIFNAAGIG